MDSNTNGTQKLVKKVTSTNNVNKKTVSKYTTFPGKSSVSFDTQLSSQLLSGYGLYKDYENVVRVSIEGIEEKESSIISITPLIRKFKAAPGLAVIGRIKAIRAKKWLIDIGTKVDATLSLSSVSLPNSEQRRKSKEETYNIRQFFKEDDVVFLEVSATKSNGVQLLMRSSNHGVLRNGILMTVPSNLIGRSNSSIVDIDDVRVIIGQNGYIWLSGTPEEKIRDCVSDYSPEDLSDSQVSAIIKIRKIISEIVAEGENSSITDLLLTNRYNNQIQ